MPTVYDRAGDITTIATSATAYYTNPSNTTSYILSIILHNTNSLDEDVEIWVVPDSSGSVGTASNSNRFWADTVEANETVFVPLPKVGIILKDANETIQAKTDTASKVTIQIKVRKDT